MSHPTARPIIIKRKAKGGHGGHHGGSWKVAYADFVTAMMAFFMVMWIVGMDEQTKKSIEGYFSNPAGFKKGRAAGASPVGSGTSPVQLRDNKINLMIHAAEKRSFSNAASRIKARLDSAHGAFGSAKYEVAVTEGGLRIELIEEGVGENFFPRSSAVLKEPARVGLSLIAQELAALRNPVVVEGHTDAAAYGVAGPYSNWELSADRANAARRLLEEAGLDRRRIAEVRGYSATKLRNPMDPLSAENRRISILLPYSEFRPPDDLSTVPQ